MCRNSAGSYICRCHTGYSLGSNKKTCSGMLCFIFLIMKSCSHDSKVFKTIFEKQTCYLFYLNKKIREKCLLRYIGPLIFLQNYLYMYYLNFLRLSVGLWTCSDISTFFLHFLNRFIIFISMLAEIKIQKLLLELDRKYK